MVNLKQNDFACDADKLKLWKKEIRDDQDDLLNSRKIQEGYAKMVNICEKACGPSTGGVPSVFAENQRINSTIFMGRPIDQTGPPIVLFHDDFGQFINDFAI
ncbi:hypothetical protein GLOIN_2v1469626 [Rhizophagus irregularis DAOM 181602=DAOM 197198]|nr:hypothetical protein GLOIN_2v1469626 [Rhizophagus irregularis DAOM 181602=DAOM 197198]